MYLLFAENWVLTDAAMLIHHNAPAYARVLCKAN